MKVAGFGVSANVDWSNSKSQSVGSGSSTSNTNGRSLSFGLGDPDRGDSFDVIIRRDPEYGTPVFITRAGRSRCRNETGTMSRESLETHWIPVNSNTAKLEVRITGLDTENEAFSYYLTGICHEDIISPGQYGYEKKILEYQDFL